MQAFAQMPRKKSVEIQLTPDQQMLLGRMNKGTSWGIRYALRADIVSRAARGQSNYGIARDLEISRNTVKKWRFRFAQEGVEGLKTRPIPGRPKKTALEPGPAGELHEMDCAAN
jgi:hypothetical protein